MCFSSAHRDTRAVVGRWKNPSDDLFLRLVVIDVHRFWHLIKVCVRERDRERERENVCVCEREREGERGRERVGVYERVIKLK